MKNSGIAWCHHTLNFWRGCSMVARECQDCYMFDDARKKKWDPNVVRLTSPETWRNANKWNAEVAGQHRSALVFTCSLSDFFHPEADRWREDAWTCIRRCPNLVWLILTKRPERIRQHLPPDWGSGWDNVWLGVTCGSPESYARVDALRQIPCSLRFLSIEPLIESVADIDLTGISWVLVGGTSGPNWKLRPMQMQWASEIYDRAAESGCAFFFKQVSAYRPERGIDGLGRFRRKKSADGHWALFRQLPKTSRRLLPLKAEKGRRFKNDQEWEKYLAALARPSFPDPFVQISGLPAGNRTHVA